MRPELSEKCAVAGAIGSNFEAARIVHPILYALQHRGQESSGITVSDEDNIHTYKDMGLVPHVYDEEVIQSLPGDMGIGHNRYATSKGSTLAHAQPVVRSENYIVFSHWRLERKRNSLGLAHNGNLPSTQALEVFLSEHNIPFQGLNDSEMMTEAIWYFKRRGATLGEAIRDAYPFFTGVFSLVVQSGNEIAAVRDPRGVRPLSIGKLNGGYVFASETCALDTVHAEHIGDVLPGQMVIADRNGNLHTEQLVNGQQNLDIFEFVYFSRPDSTLLGESVYEVRKRLGRNLFLEQRPPDVDMVIPVPLSAIPAAIGYSHASGIPFELALAKNPYINRTFIQPDQHLRERGVALKLNPIGTTIKGKRVLIIDDSVVRGTNGGPIVKLFREAGAREVHMKISSPPVLYPDFYGIDTPDQNELIAATRSLDEIRGHLGVDSLQYLSYDGLINATGLPEEVFSTSCFTGIYPIDIGERKKEVSTIVFEGERTPSV